MRYLATTTPLILIAACTLALVEAPSRAQEQNEVAESTRRYEEGPLSAADFLAPIPEVRLVGEDVLADAYTTTRLQFEYRYSYRVQRNIVRAQVDSINLSAVVVPGQSWNTHKDDEELMDHEQGHFDIAQAATLAARLELLKLKRAGPLFETTATTVDGAVKKLEERVEAFIDRYSEDIRRQDSEYDRQTRHGQSDDEQAKHRAHQIAAIESAMQKLQLTSDD